MLLLLLLAPEKGVASNDRRQAMKRKGLRVFVVENHPDTVLGLRMLLDVLGHHVHVARNLKAAQVMARKIEFDVLLSDISLPDGTGLDLMRELRAERPVVGIAMSGYGAESDIAKSKAAGFIEHLVKPMTAEELGAALENAAKLVGPARGSKSAASSRTRKLHAAAKQRSQP
jgi:CheY-like chemotaxis protein